MTVYPFFRDFHGGNTGSNPVGDANKIKDLSCMSVTKIFRVRQAYAIKCFGQAEDAFFLRDARGLAGMFMNC